MVWAASATDTIAPIGEAQVPLASPRWRIAIVLARSRAVGLPQRSAGSVGPALPGVRPGRAAAKLSDASAASLR
mgnify:CR=1 FL=1